MNERGLPKSREQIEAEYAEKFLSGHPEASEAMKQEIEAAGLMGNISFPIGRGGITEEDKARFSAYRQIAKSMGYEIGGVSFHEVNYTATAPIRRIELAT